MAIRRYLGTKLITTFCALSIIACNVSNADERADADVVFVEAVNSGSNNWTFNVTVLHPDTGWDDYCNGWNIVTNEGEILKRNSSDEFTRLLLHPHESEQPFTRSQQGLQIPDGTQSLTVGAHDLIHGFGGKEVTLELSIDNGENYRIVRQ